MGSGSSAAAGPQAKQDDIALSIGELIREATDAFKSDDISEAHLLLKKAKDKLPSLGAGQREVYSIMVHSKQGSFFYREGLFAKAEVAYTIAIRLEEAQIEEKCRGLYLMLQRYKDDMCDLARIHKMDGDGRGTTNDEANAQGSNANGTAKAAATGAIGPKRAEEYLQCENLLVRCIETIEGGHNRRSDLLVEPLSLLAELYEQLGMYARAELLCRRMKGIMIVQYGHDHPGLSELNGRIDALTGLREEKAITTAAIKIQSVFRMRRDMTTVGSALGKVMKRHRLAGTTKSDVTRKSSFLADYCNKIPAGNEAGHIVDATEVATTAVYGDTLSAEAGAPLLQSGATSYGRLPTSSHGSRPRIQSSSKLRGNEFRGIAPPIL